MHCRDPATAAGALVRDPVELNDKAGAKQRVPAKQVIGDLIVSNGMVVVKARGTGQFLLTANEFYGFAAHLQGPTKAPWRSRMGGLSAHRHDRPGPIRPREPTSPISCLPLHSRAYACRRRELAGAIAPSRE